MGLSSQNMLSLLLQLLVSSLPAAAAVSLRDSGDGPCTYPNRCWPSDSTWASLNRTLQGGLVRARPPAAVCHVNELNPTACQEAKGNWTLDFWRAEQPGGYMDVAWENGDSYCNIDNDPNVPCSQGLVPLYMAQVKSTADVQAAVSFARDHNLSTRVKGASHDYRGRSSGNGTFGIQTIKLKGIEFDDDFKLTGAKGDVSPQPAVHVAAGEYWYYVNKAASDRGVLVVGGSSYSVGAAGGWILGGGHSSLSPQYGLGVDNVLQFEIVTPDGKLRTANKCQNTDLFWALRGGGPGFGVVTKVTYKTHPKITAISAILVNGTYTNASYHGFLKTLMTLQPALTAHNFSGYFYPFPTMFVAQLLVHNSADLSGANATLHPLFAFAESETAQGRPVTIQTQAYVFTDYFQLFPDPPEKDSESGVGVAAILGSRLAPITAFQEGKVDALVNFLVSPPAIGNVQFLLVAGGQVNKVGANATAVHPSWRQASHHIILSTGWGTNTTFATRNLLRTGLTNLTQTLASIIPGFGSYQNEADANEPHWADTFWGSNYPRLRGIKSNVDPRGLFTCHHCAGDD